MSTFVNFEISSALNNKSCKISAYTVNQLNIPDNKINVSNLKKQFLHFRDINLRIFQNSEVTLLIGTNYADFPNSPGLYTWKRRRATCNRNAFRMGNNGW